MSESGMDWEVAFSGRLHQPGGTGSCFEPEGKRKIPKVLSKASGDAND
jgi:hypothetical protein